MDCITRYNIAVEQITSSHSWSGAKFVESLIDKVVKVVFAVFSKIRDLSSRFDRHTNEGNLKVFALAGCVSLIALIAVSMFRSRSKVAPTTPYGSPKVQRHK